MVVDEGAGFPREVSALRRVKGIGDYTAGAIASIAFKEVSVLQNSCIDCFLLLSVWFTELPDDYLGSACC